MVGEHISNEELLKDIFETEKESKAYSLLEQGYKLLMELPENQEVKILSRLGHEEKRYFENQKDCEVFLKDLYKIKSERGL